MAKEDKTPRTNPAEIESLIEQIRAANLDPRAKEKIERLLRTILTLVELLQRKNTSIKKLREMIFGKRTERHQARKTEGREKVDESEKSDDGQPKAAGDQDARAELRAIGSGDKPKRKGHGHRAASDYSGAKIVRCRHERSERALKQFILMRKNSMFFKTEHGAAVGDVLASLIRTCRLNGINAWDYLVTIIGNKKDARSNPDLYLPWNYKGDEAESLAA